MDQNPVEFLNSLPQGVILEEDLQRLFTEADIEALIKCRTVEVREMLITEYQVDQPLYDSQRDGFIQPSKSPGITAGKIETQARSRVGKRIVKWIIRLKNKAFEPAKLDHDITVSKIAANLSQTQSILGDREWPKLINWPNNRPRILPDLAVVESGKVQYLIDFISHFRSPRIMALGKIGKDLNIPIRFY